MQKQTVPVKSSPPIAPSTRSEPELIEGRAPSAPFGRPRIHDTTTHTARPVPSLATKPFDWRSAD
jgi:hypothetical protein